MLLRDLDEEKSKSYGPAPRTLYLRAFSSLIGQVTEYAMNRIADDWEACKQAVNAGTYCCAQQTGMHRMDGSNCLVDYLTE
jgi:hypothetical protein